MADSEKRDGDRKFVAPEGGWGWVVCLASFWINATIFGLNNSFGVLLVAMLGDPTLQKHGATVFNTAWIGSITVCISFFATYIASILTDRFGCRRTAVVGAIIAFVGCLSSSFAKRLGLLYFTYGILIGVGFALAYMPSLIILGHYFEKKIGKANGFATCGSGVSTVLLPPVLRYLINTIGLWHTLHFIAGLTFLLIPCALTFKSQRPKVKRKQINSSVDDDTSTNNRCCSSCKSWLGRYINFEIWKNKNYRIWCSGVLIGLLGYFVPFTHLIKYVEEVSPDPSTNGPILISCIGLSSIVGAVAPGRLSDMEAVKRFMTRIEFQQLSFIVIGTFNFLVPTLVLSFPALVVATLIMGIFDGCFVCMMVPVAIDILGPEDASQAIGFIFCIIAFPMLVGGPAAGLIYDMTGSYNLAFILAGIPPMIGTFIMCFVKFKEPPAKPTVDDGEDSMDGNSERLPLKDVSDRSVEPTEILNQRQDTKVKSRTSAEGTSSEVDAFI